MCKGTQGHPGEEGPPGPPTLKELLTEYIKSDPTLNEHFFFTNWKEGVYIETLCNWGERNLRKRNSGGYSLALLPHQENLESSGNLNRVTIYYHGFDRMRENKGDLTLSLDDQGAKVRGYLKAEDPQFFTKLRDFLILGHDGLYRETNCKIKWKYGETLPDREEAARQPWWQDGEDL